MAREYKGKAEVKQMKKEMREGKRKRREQPKNNTEKINWLLAGCCMKKGSQQTQC